MDVKKIITLLFGIILAYPLFGETVFEYEGINYRIISESDRTVEVAVNKDCSGDINIPYKVNGYTVASVGSYAFEGCTKLTRVRIPNTVIAIEDEAFLGCTTLEQVTFEEGYEVLITKCPVGKIFPDSPIKTIYLGRNLKYPDAEYNSEPFKCSNTLNKVVIYNKVDSIPSDMFRGCVALQEIKAPYSVTSVGARAFSQCTHLYKVEMPGVKIIGDKAFYGCTGLSSVVLRATTIGEYAFHETGLVKINFLLFCTKLGKGVFSNCTLLTEASLPNSLTTVPEETFDGCSGLTRITLPETITKIERMAFSGCSGLAEINSLNGIPPQGGDPFAAADKETCIVNIPVGCTSAYRTNEGWNGFFKIKEIYTDRFVSDGINYKVISEEQKTVEITQGYGCIGNFIIPDVVNGYTVTGIGNYAFKECIGLVEVTIPCGVTRIGTGAFSGCLRLTGVIIPNTVKTIESAAFKGCISLTKIVIPNSVTNMGVAFAGCTGIREVVLEDAAISSWYTLGALFPDSPLQKAYIGRNLGDEGASEKSVCLETLETIELSSFVTKINDYAFSNYTALKRVIIPPSVTRIGISGFNNCKSLSEIELPGVTYIAGYAFSRCSSLKSISMPSVSYIGEWAFTDSGLSSLSMPSVITIIENAFRDCLSLESVTLPSTLMSFGQQAFLNCSSLKEVVIHNSLTVIPEFAFGSCTNLTHVTIPESVTKIYSSSFIECPNIVEINCLANTPPQIGDSFFEVDKEVCVLNIPVKCTSAYRSSDGWKEFFNIKEIDFTSVPETTLFGSETIKVYSSGGELYIENGISGQAISVYNTGGTLIKWFVASENTIRCPLPQGIYIIRAGKETHKVKI